MSRVRTDWSWSVDGEEWAHLWRELDAAPLFSPAAAAQAAVATGDVPKNVPFLVAGLSPMGYVHGGQRHTYLLTDDGLYTKVGEA